MTGKTPCIHCGVIGYVRKEQVIKANEAYTRFYCRCCEGAWPATDSGDTEQVHKERTPDKPDRSRS
jgi:hypothetical protein